MAAEPLESTEENCLQLMGVMFDAIAAWHKEGGRGAMRAEVIITPALNVALKAMSKEDCPHCRTLLLVNAAKFFIDLVVNEEADHDDGPHISTGHVH